MKGKYYSPLFKVLIFIIDFWLIERAFAVTEELGLVDGISRSEFTTFFLIFSLIWIIAGFLYKIYRVDTFSLMRTVSINLFNAFLVHILMIIAILRTFNVFTVDMRFLTAIYALTAVFIVGMRVVYKLIMKYI